MSSSSNNWKPSKYQIDSHFIPGFYWNEKSILCIIRRKRLSPHYSINWFFCAIHDYRFSLSPDIPEIYYIAYCPMSVLKVSVHTLYLYYYTPSHQRISFLSCCVEIMEIINGKSKGNRIIIILNGTVKSYLFKRQWS